MVTELLKRALLGPGKPHTPEFFLEVLLSHLFLPLSGFLLLHFQTSATVKQQVQHLFLPISSPPPPPLLSWHYHPMTEFLAPLSPFSLLSVSIIHPSIHAAMFPPFVIQPYLSTTDPLLPPPILLTFFFSLLSMLVF